MNVPTSSHFEMHRAFHEVEAEWLAIIEPPARTWDAEVASMIRQQDALIAAGHWIGGPSDLLSVIGKPRWETFHSAVVAWLLWPNAQHRLGTTLLDRLLRRCFPENEFEPDVLMRCSTQTEVSKANSRADIIVAGPSLKVVIEVKVDASEGENQCQRLYADHIDDHALFVFLTPTGAAVKTAGDDDEAWVSLSFTHLRDDLEASLAAAEPNSEGGRATALSYLETLRREFR